MNRSDELIKDISYSKDSHLILKNREKHILTELNREIRNTNNLNKISSRKKSSVISSNKTSFDYRYNNAQSMIKVKDNYINMKNFYDNNSISFSPKKNNDNNINVPNNFSEFIILQKNTKNIMTDINIIKKHKTEKETISKSKSNDNFNININDYQEPKPKFISYIKNQQSNNQSQSLKNNNIKLNNFIKSSQKYFLLYNRPTKVSKKCFICDNYSKVLFHAEKCSHCFCGVCGRLFFEQQINNCIYKLKCPKYSCHKCLSIKILKRILSKYIFEKMLENIDGNGKTFDKNIINMNQNINSSRDRIVKKNSLFSSDHENKIVDENKNTIYNMTFQKGCSFYNDKNSVSKKISKKDLLLKKLTGRYHKNSDKDLANEHVIKVTGSSKFNKAVRKINEFKNIYCSNCNKASLFPIKNKPFIKCLNCGYSTCKFCYKKYDYLHLIRNNEHSCRVFFRTRNNKQNVKYIYLYQLLYIFGGLIVLYVGFTKIEARYLCNYNRYKIFSIYLILFSILIIFNFTILIIIFPFYPLILLIVDM
jgi:hypothetical protein